jgi:sulfatase modifying factor 1
MSLRPSSRPVRGAFRVALCVPLLVVGCGGRTNGATLTSGSGTDSSSGGSAGTSGASSGAGSVSGGVGGTAGAVSGSSGAVSGESAGVTSGVFGTGTTTGSGSAAGAGTGSSSSSGSSPACPVCPTGATCVDGTCSCPVGWTACEGASGLTACVTAQTVQSDPSNCGHCRIQCPASVPICQNGSCEAPPSCALGGPGMTNCGASSESCCTSLEVTGGTYFRTYTNDGIGPTSEADPATVSGFRLDKYLVTVGRFRQFVNVALPPEGGTGWLPSPGSGKHAYLNNGNGLAATGGGYEPGWVASDDSNILVTGAHLAVEGDYATWTASPGSQENLPMNFVNWYESYAFCIWDGGFLPSEAEWEYAAAGGSQQREYPWGSTAPGTANQYAIYADATTGECFYPSFGAPCAGAANIAPVGYATQGAGLWGQLDLAGDVWEWNIDWYAYSYVDPCTDCAGSTAESIRVVRGGDFASDASNLLPPLRDNFDPHDRQSNLGFRCARTP